MSFDTIVVLGGLWIVTGLIGVIMSFRARRIFNKRPNDENWGVPISGIVLGPAMLWTGYNRFNRARENEELWLAQEYKTNSMIERNKKRMEGDGKRRQRFIKDAVARGDIVLRRRLHTIWISNIDSSFGINELKGHVSLTRYDTEKNGHYLTRPGGLTRLPKEEFRDRYPIEAHYELTVTQKDHQYYRIAFNHLFGPVSLIDTEGGFGGNEGLYQVEAGILEVGKEYHLPCEISSSGSGEEVINDIVYTWAYTTVADGAWSAFIVGFNGEERPALGDAMVDILWVIKPA